MKALSFFLALFLGSCAYAEGEKFWLIDQRFMPENELYKLDHIDEPVNITESQFEEVLVYVESFYKPLVKRLYDADLEVVRDWKDSTVNAYATRSGSTWEIHMFGGLARRKEITPDGFALVACHEMGHHVAGFPYVQSWAANEGQSDYFSTLSCARRLWKDDLAKNAESAETISPYPKSLCDRSWPFEDDRNLCYRAVQAGKSLADLLSAGSAKYETPDRSVVNRTNSQHPGGQCRLDTYIAGALCKVEFDSEKIPRSERESAKVSCLESRKQLGYRPKCWFKASL